jgi:hypothetical protein
MSNNTQLPDEVAKELTDKANDYAHDKVGNIQTIPAYQIRQWECAADGWEDGATEYATKLQLEKDDNQVNLQEITNLSNLVKEKDERIRLLSKACGEFDNENQDNYKGRKEARALLEKFISRHEAGLLPDRFIYNEIKQYLDGTK